MKDKRNSEQRVLRRVFKGDSRRIACRDVTGCDCNRVMDDEAENCGDPTHVRKIQPGEFLGDAEFRTKSSFLRMKLTVNEEYDLIFDEASDAVEFDKESFKPGELWVSTKVQEEFTAYHDCSAEVAIENLRLLVERSINDGKYYSYDWGGHCFTWRGFVAIVSPNLQTVIRYQTRHYERTPKQVIEGVKSRLSKRRGVTRPSGPVPDSIELGNELEGVVSSLVDFGVFVRISPDFDALLHQSELGSSATAVNSVFQVGQRIQVKVIGIDRERMRVNLGLVAESPEDGPTT